MENLLYSLMIRDTRIRNPSGRIIKAASAALVPGVVPRTTVEESAEPPMGRGILVEGSELVGAVLVKKVVGPVIRKTVVLGAG